MSRANGDEMEITLYLTGINKEDARGSWIWDTWEGADSYCIDNPGNKIYSVVATLDFSTLEEDDGQ